MFFILFLYIESSSVLTMTSICWTTFQSIPSLNCHYLDLWLSFENLCWNVDSRYRHWYLTNCFAFLDWSVRAMRAGRLRQHMSLPFPEAEEHLIDSYKRLFFGVLPMRSPFNMKNQFKFFCKVFQMRSKLYENIYIKIFEDQESLHHASCIKWTYMIWTNIENLKLILVDTCINI